MNKICLIFEGAYPYVRGGVAQWAHELIGASPDYEFSIVAVTAEKKTSRDWRYTLPAHVKEVRTINLHQPLNPLLGFLENLKISRNGRQFSDLLALGLTKASAGDYSRLGDVVDYLDRFQMGRLDIRRQTSLWPLLTQVYNRTDGQGSFAPFFWAWDNLAASTLRLLRDPLPEADLYHSASTGLAGFLGIIAKIRSRKPFVLSEHGLYLQERQMELTFDDNLAPNQRGIVESFFDSLSRWAYFEADRVTSLSRFIRDHQISMGAAVNKTEIIPNGIDLDRFSALPRQPHRGFHVGLVGRLAPVKDIELLIVAAKELLPSIPNLRVSIIGPVEDPQYFEECNRKVHQLGLQDVIDFTGVKNQEECYGDLDVLVMCSLKEVQPLTLLEGMAVGVPIVATRTGAIPEMMANTSIIIPPRDPKSLVRAILKLRADPDFSQKIIQAGKERVKNYDRAKMVGRFHHLYDNLIAREAQPWPASA